MKHLSLILIGVLILISSGAVAQTVISSGGTDTKGSGIALSWTLGEVISETFTNGSTTLTQGFHQSKLGTTAVDNILIPGLRVLIYPNPIADALHIKVDEGDYSKLQYTLLNMEGKVLLNKKLTRDITRLDMQQFTAGSYLVLISRKTGETVKTVKVVKQ